MTAEEIIEELPKLSPEELESVNAAVAKIKHRLKVDADMAYIKELARQNAGWIQEAWGGDPQAEIRRMRDEE